jgi:hypothetical protein
MYIACSHSDEKRVTIYVTTYKSGFAKATKARLPKDAILSNTFTLMDTSEEQVFLYVENHGLQSPFGNVFISENNGVSFSLSMENVIKGDAVDFEKVASLDGTYVLNKFVTEHDHNSGRLAAIKEFDEADMIAFEAKNSRLGRSAHGEGGQNKKQKMGRQQIEETVPAQEVQESVQTFITHNKGGKWELIKAPTVTSKGKAIDCYIEDGCSLHLEIYSHQGELAPVYSTKNAVGIVMGTGNLGKRLTENDQAKNLYISRDGGLNWRSVKPGVFIYEIGDHGSIIVIAEKGKPTKEVEFSWDEGQTWETL